MDEPAYRAMAEPPPSSGGTLRAAVGTVGVSELASTDTERSRDKEVTVAGKFEVYQDKAGKYRFRLKAGNGEVVATGEAYESKSSARAGCEAVQRAAAGASIVEADS